MLWLQLGVRSDKAKDIAEAAGLRVVQDRCPKIEFSRLFGELGWHGFNSGVISSKRRPVGSNPDAKPAAQKGDEGKGVEGGGKKEEKKKTPDVVFRGFETRAIHAGAAPDATTGGSSPRRAILANGFAFFPHSEIYPLGGMATWLCPCDGTRE